MIRFAVAALVAGLSLGVAPSAAQAQVVQNEGPVIVTTGEASITSAPDRAWLDIASEGRAAKTVDAQRIAAEAMTAVQTALKARGIAPEAIKTTGYTVQPEYDFVNGRQTFKDTVARNQIEVRVDDISRLGDLVDAVGASGAASVSGLRFDIKARATIEHEALARAVKDAMERATAIAAGASRTLGPILRIEEQRFSEATPRAMTMTAGFGALDKAATPIAPGEIEIRARVTLTVGIR